MAASSMGITTIGDGLWIAAALLHREQPERPDFANAEIEARLAEEAFVDMEQPGIATHLSRHGVANKSDNGASLRFFYATGHGRKRLFRRGDSYHPDREGPEDHGGTRIHPRKEDIPARFHYLIDWYLDEYSRPRQTAGASDPILAMRGLGTRLASGEHPDDYVGRLRENWR